jgi:DNA-binding CsgD family transcriptional regulator
MPFPKPRHLWHQLDLLCKAGIGIEAIAHDATALIRQLVGADAAAIFWLNEQGLPDGFFHEDSPSEVQSLFLDEFERLFVGANEINVFALARHRGRRIGNLILPPADYFKSNTFNLLVKPSGHRHSLDLRVEVDGMTRVVVLLFRGGNRRFGDDEAARLDGIAPYLQRALRSVQPDLECSVLASGYLLASVDGSRILMHSGEAAMILQGANRAGTGACKAGTMDRPPPFLHRLCLDAVQVSRPPLVREFAVPGGRIEARATPLEPVTTADVVASRQVLVEMKLLRPRRLEIVRRIAGIRLSPTQREIALLAGMGHQRADCLQVVGVSKEALKKHLKAVYAATGTDDWDSLGRELAR